MKEILSFYTSEQIKKIQAWKVNLPEIDEDVFGSEYLYEYSFYPTGLGVVAKVRRVDGQELDLTDYDSW